MINGKHLPSLLAWRMISVERFCIFKNRNSPDLEENLRAHAEETVDDPERKHHGHAVDEPRDGLESECRL